MDITSANMQALFTGYRANFQAGLSSLGEQSNAYQLLCTVVPSTNPVEAYPWMRTLPQMREWLGDRVVHALGSDLFSIRNRKFELTEGIDRDAIEDDTYGLYAPTFTEFGRVSAEHPNILAVEVLESNPLCFDGQNLFDADHPTIVSEGQTTTQANIIEGAGPAWYVADLSRAVKPLIFQRRRDYSFRTINRLDDTQVFLTDKFLYGVDARVNAGPALWQLIVRSKATFNATNYAAARAMLTTIAGDYGRKLGIRHTHTIVPQNLEGAARKVINNALSSGGETNEWAGTSQLVLLPWLATS